MNKLQLNFIDSCSSYMKEELNIDDKYVDSNIDVYKKNNIEIIEIAHTPQFFHIGIINVFIKALSKTITSKNNTLILLSINDHLPARVISESRIFKYLINNSEPKNKFSIVSKKDSKYMMNSISSPSIEKINQLSDILRYTSNRLDKKNKQDYIEKLNELISIFKINQDLNSLSSWYVKVLFDYISKFDDFNMLIFPTSKYNELFDNEINFITNNIVSINEVKNNEENFNNVDINSLPYWLYCNKCNIIHPKRVFLDKDTYCFECNEKLNYNNWLPDVVLRQILSVKIGISQRYHGVIKPYTIISDKLSNKLYNKVPIRQAITNKVVFNGFRSDYKDEQKANFYNILLESDMKLLYKKLVNSSGDIYVKSKYKDSNENN